MPGPRATNRKTRAAAPNSPTRKVANRLAARIAAMPINSAGSKYHYIKPGSQNRKK